MLVQQKPCCNLDELLVDINKLRNELINIALTNGIDNCKTIMLSQELDTYILQYQLCKKHLS